MAPKAMPPPCRPQLDDADLLEAANDDVDDFDLIEAVAEIADDDVDDDDRDEEAVDLIEAVRQNQSRRDDDDDDDDADAYRRGTSRFARGERVVCYLGVDGWSAGAIAAVDEDAPWDPSRTIPYVVKLDTPAGALINVACDSSEVCRAEICFDAESERGVELSLRCLPTRASAAARRRFAVDDRVACAVADASGAWTDWAAGTVLEVDHAVDADVARRVLRDRADAAPPPRVPYRVRLDAARDVLVHRDEHSLVRDLALQPAGPRQAAGGARTLAKFAKRQRGDEWEMVDHATRKVRRIAGDRDSD